MRTRSYHNPQPERAALVDALRKEPAMQLPEFDPAAREARLSMLGGGQAPDPWAASRAMLAPRFSADARTEAALKEPSSGMLSGLREAMSNARPVPLPPGLEGRFGGAGAPAARDSMDAAQAGAQAGGLPAPMPPQGAGMPMEKPAPFPQPLGPMNGLIGKEPPPNPSEVLRAQIGMAMNRFNKPGRGMV